MIFLSPNKENKVFQFVKSEFLSDPITYTKIAELYAYVYVPLWMLT